MHKPTRCKDTGPLPPSPHPSAAKTEVGQAGPTATTQYPEGQKHSLLAILSRTPKTSKRFSQASCQGMSKRPHTSQEHHVVTGWRLSTESLQFEADT